MIEMGRLTCPGSSLCCSDNDDDVATPTTCLRVCPPIPVVDLAERQNDCSSAELHDTSNPVHDIDPTIDSEDPDSDDGDELSHFPSWLLRGSTSPHLLLWLVEALASTISTSVTACLITGGLTTRYWLLTNTVTTTE